MTRSKANEICMPVTACLADPRNNRDVLTTGFSYLPLPPYIAIKIDYQRWEDGGGDHGYRVNTGLAYQFH